MYSRRTITAALVLALSVSALASCSTDSGTDATAATAAEITVSSSSSASEAETAAAAQAEEAPVLFAAKTDSSEYDTAPFSSYTFDFSDGENSYMITIELALDGSSFNITTEDSSFAYSEFKLTAPENYILNIPFSQDSASSVCKIIKNTVDSEVMPDILEFTFYLNNFEDESLAYSVKKYYTVKEGKLLEIKLVDETADEPSEMDYCSEISMLHTESRVFMPVPQVEIDKDGNVTADVYTYTFSYEDMTMTKRLQSSDYSESPLYYGYMTNAAANYIAKYFTTTSLNVTDYENYVEMPSVNSDTSDYFFKVDDPRFSTVEELKNFARKFFSEKLVNDLFINAPQKYRDIDGALYTIVGDGGMDFTLGDLTITSWEENGNTVTYHTKQEKFDDEGKFKEFIDGGDFTVERTDSGFTVTQYRIVY